MPHQFSNDRLNELLIALGRSLLQYVGESWPWSADNDLSEQAAINQMVAEQQESIALIANLLAARGHLIDPGAYPTDYTSLHYVALDYLLSQLVEQQQFLAGEARAAMLDAHGDEEAELLLTGVSAQVERHAAELQRLLEERKGPARWSVQDKLGPAPNPV